MGALRVVLLLRGKIAIYFLTVRVQLQSQQAKVHISVYRHKPRARFLGSVTRFSNSIAKEITDLSQAPPEPSWSC